MQQRTNIVLYGYWNDIRADRLAPSRFEIEPSRISSVLAETFILEATDTQSYDFRLAGTRICEQIGAELRGRNFLDFAGDETRGEAEAAMASITRQGAVGIFELVGRDAQGRSAKFEAIVLPLLHGQDIVSRYLGAVAAIDPPAWLGHEPLAEFALRVTSTFWPDGRPHALLARADSQAPFRPEFEGARIVRSNRRQFRILDGGKGPDAGRAPK